MPSKCLQLLLLALLFLPSCDAAKAQKAFYSGSELESLAQSIWPGATRTYGFTYGAGMRGRADIASFPAASSPGEETRVTLFLLGVDKSLQGAELESRIDTTFKFFFGSSSWKTSPAEPGFFFVGGSEQAFRHRKVIANSNAGPFEVSQYLFEREFADHRAVLVIHGQSDHIDAIAEDLDEFLAHLEHH